MENVEEWHDINDAEWLSDSPSFAKCRMPVRDCKRQPQIHQRGVLDFSRIKTGKG